MKAKLGQVVRFHYAISDDAGVEVETSRGGDPVLALLGYGNLMLGVEEAIVGHAAGETFSTTLTPEQAFGPRREGWTQRISKKHFPKGARFQAGATLRLHTDQGAKTVTVLKVGSKFVDVDLNHPLAGMTVTFQVDLEDVREATAEERAHRHAHGAGGHQH
jgi:FKBP-type peptidyl-prolyl cis-trans isomerase SlyD